MPRITILALLLAAITFAGCGSSDNGPSAPVVPNPSDLRATVLSYSSVRITWTDNSPNEAGFRVERAPLGGNNYTRLPDLPSNTTTFTDTGLTEGNTFNYRVAAFSGATNSPSDPLPVAIPLITPTGVTGQRLSTTSIGLTWTDASSNETGYQVEMKVRGAAVFDAVGDLEADAAEFTAEGLTPRTFYVFRVRAVKDTVGSAWAQSGAIETTVLTPTAPTELVATTRLSRPNSVTLTWYDGAYNEDGYMVEISFSEGSGFAPVDTTFPDNNSSVITGLTAETVYFFRVYAFNAYGNSEYSNVVGIEVPGPPAAPSELTANAPDYRGVDLRWVDNSRNEEGFYIERRPANSPNAWSRIETTGPDTMLYFDGDVVQNQSYVYRVQAFNDAPTPSEYSNEAEVTVPDGPPAAPISLSANTLDIDKVILAWNDIANNEDFYFLERRLHGAGEFETVAVLDMNINIHIDTALVPETAYDYRVYAINGNGQSDYSNEAVGRTLSLTVFADGFETYPSENNPGNPWVVSVTGSSTAKVTSQFAHDGNKSLKIHDPDNGASAIVSRSGMNLKAGSIKAWLKIPANSYFGFIGGDASANVYITWQIQFNGDNSFFVRDGSGLINPGGTYPLNEWFEIEVAFSTDSSKYQVFFNGDAVTDTVSLQRTDHVPNGALYMIAFSDQPLYDGFVDDVSAVREYHGPDQAPRRVSPVGMKRTYVGEGPRRVEDALKAPFAPNMNR